MYPADQLHMQGGHKCVLGTHTVVEESEKFKSIQYELNKVPDAELYIFQLPLHPEFTDLQKYLQSRGKKVVVELDDDYFHLPDYNPAKAATAPDKNKPHKASILNLLWCVRHADACTVTTPALRNTIQEVAPDVPVYVLRNFLDWRVFEPRNVLQQRGWSKFRVGYLGAAQWHSGDLREIASWFPEWIASRPDVEFVCAGDQSIHEILGVPEGQRVSTDILAFRHQEIADIVCTMDVGLVPLVRNRFNEAKSHLKGMEYAGCGIPCIATPTESYREWWLAGSDGGSGGAGFLADGPDEWVSALDRLSADRELLGRMGRHARQLAEENTIQQHWRLWEQAYTEILGGVVADHRSYTHASGQRTDAFGVLLER